MAVYLVTFKLSDPGANPVPVVEAIKKVGTGWMHYIPGVIFIHSNETAEHIARKLFKLITKDDYLLVIEVGQNYYGWLPADAWPWLQEALK